MLMLILLTVGVVSIRLLMLILLKVGVVSIRLLMLILLTMSVVSIRVLMLLHKSFDNNVAKSVVSIRVSISILLLLKAVYIDSAAVNMPAIVWGDVLNDVSGSLELRSYFIENTTIIGHGTLVENGSTKCNITHISGTYV